MDEVQQQLSLQECTKILQNCFKRSNFKVKSRSVLSLSNTVEGFLGQHFSVTIEYDDNGDQKSVRYFMKILNGSLKTIFEITSSLNIYEKENFFYNHLLKEFENFKVDTSFAPREFFSKKYLIVLEDLSVKGYTPRSKSELFDYDHCKIALNTLAKFHSSYILYEKAKSNCRTINEEFPNMFQDPFTSEGENVAKTWLDYSLKGLLALSELIPENGNSNVTFSKKLLEVLEEAQSHKERNKNKKQVLLHGDLWTSNILFKYRNGEPVDSIIIDYQLFSYGPPSIDVVHLLLVNTRKTIRDKYYDALLDFYYTSLKSYLPDFDMDTILTRDEFLSTCAEFKQFEKIMCTLDRCTTFMPKSVVNDSIRTDEEFRKFLFDDRVKLMLDAYNNNKSYKELIEEDLLELRDMVFHMQ